jgi:hypothetical protein
MKRVGPLKNSAEKYGDCLCLPPMFKMKIVEVVLNCWKERGTNSEAGSAIR